MIDDNDDGEATVRSEAVGSWRRRAHVSRSSLLHIDSTSLQCCARPGVNTSHAYTAIWSAVSTLLSHRKTSLFDRIDLDSGLSSRPGAAPDSRLPSATDWTTGNRGKFPDGPCISCTFWLHARHSACRILLQQDLAAQLTNVSPCCCCVRCITSLHAVVNVCLNCSFVHLCLLLYYIFCISHFESHMKDSQCVSPKLKIGHVDHDPYWLRP